MHTVTERPRVDVPMMMAVSIGSPVVTRSRSLDWGNDACRPVLDRAKFLTNAVGWDEFHALLFVPRSLLPGSVETQVKRNITRWYTRRVSFWDDCDELIQEWLNNVMESVASEESRARGESADYNSAL